MEVPQPQPNNPQPEEKKCSKCGGSMFSIRLKKPLKGRYCSACASLKQAKTKRICKPTVTTFPALLALYEGFPEERALFTALFYSACDEAHVCSYCSYDSPLALGAFKRSKYITEKKKAQFKNAYAHPVSACAEHIAQYVAEHTLAK